MKLLAPDSSRPDRPIALDEEYLLDLMAMGDLEDARQRRRNQQFESFLNSR